MNFKKKMRKKQLKNKVSKKQRKKLKTIVEVLSERGCKEAKFEVGKRDSEFTISELEAFCELYGFRLIGINEKGICVPSCTKNGILLMLF